MPKFIPHDGPMREIAGPLTLTALQGYVGGFIEFRDLLNDDIMVTHEEPSNLPVNGTASVLAGRRGPIHGHAVLCSPEDIA